jgi:protein TonB
MKKAYLNGLKPAIAAHQFFPEEAKRRRESGTVVVGFVLEQDGRITGIHLRRSSGSALIDQAAQDSLRRLGRYKPIPWQFGIRTWNLSVPIVYDLRTADR